MGNGQSKSKVSKIESFKSVGSIPTRNRHSDYQNDSKHLLKSNSATKYNQMMRYGGMELWCIGKEKKSELST